MKTAIIDDNVQFTTYLESVLKKSPYIKSINVYYSAEEFLDMYEETDYDLLFVDIGLPQQSGIDLVNIVNGSPRKMQTVFITGHPEFMAEAFQMKVSDYIIKPVSEEAIFSSIEYLKKRMDAFQTDNNQNKYTNSEIKVLLIRNGSDTRIINQSDIIFIEKQNKKCLIHTVSGIVESVYSLEFIHNKLDHNIFFRTHRGYIVNKNMICGIEKWSDRAYIIKMLNTAGKPLLSRNEKKNFFSFLSGDH